MKKIFSLIILSVSGLLFVHSSQAQVSGYLGDVSRYSQTISGGGTARFRAMGGAGTALGGDISSAFLNPAGLGFFNRSVFSITPIYFSSGNDATYLGSSDYQFKNNFGINNLGFAFRGSNPTNGGSGWLGGTFAITYQQLNNFTNRFSYQGENPESSYVDSFLAMSDQEIDNLINQGDLHTSLAFDSYLIDDKFSYVENGEEIFFYDTYFPLASATYPILERESVRTSGSQGQWNFSYGGNFGDKVYLGAGIGITSLTYRRQSTFTDEASPRFYTEQPQEEVDRFPNNRFVMEEDLRQEGGGINATLGVILRPIQEVTLGLSYRTPTFYSVEETYSLRYNTYFRDDNTVETAESDLMTFNYNLRTPGVLNAGAAYFIEKYGVLTVDVEYMDYSNSRLTDNDNFLREDNQDIPEFYGSALNTRIGGELRYDNLRFRLGYAHQQSPYSGDYEGNYDTNTFSGGNTYSAGIGLRLKAFFADLAVVRQQRNLLYYPSGRPDVSIQNRQTSALLTVGINF